MFRSYCLEPEQSKHAMDTEETRLSPQKVAVRDKYCQTDHHQHGCCNQESAVEPGDPPLLQQPVQTSRSGILQIIESFRSGTKQLRLMLLREVDTIFECKSCRSLFRGLPNLITHKQFYCISKHFEHFVDEDPPNENKQSQVVKDLLDTVYPRANQSEYVVQLEPIQTNQNAVFQTFKPISEVNLDGKITSDSADIQEEDTASVPSSALPAESETVVPTSCESVKGDTTSSFPNAEDSDVPHNADRTVKRANNSNPFSCRLCKKDFNCRRSVRRHIKKLHKKKLEEIKKFIEIRRNTPLSSTKGHGKLIYKAASKSCDICHKSFATKANTRRHIDEVHRGMRRDYATQEINTKPGKTVIPETVTPKKSLKTISRTQKLPAKSEVNVSSCTCPFCNRRYTSQFLLKKHVKIVHKTASSVTNVKSDKGYNHISTSDSKIKTENSNTMDSSSNTVKSSPKSESKGLNHAQEKKSTATLKGKAKSDGDSPKPGSSPSDDKKKYKKPKLSAGFDFKQLYCKLCKRQFTSKQNLIKHIELHTDGNCIFVKFYRCPLCSYETRRKRDVIRHITVVHKKSQRALIKITANLESRAIKKPIESILEKVSKRGPQKDKVKKTGSKQDVASSASTKKSEGADAGIEVKLTKTFSLLKCKMCGKAFAKKKDLDQHKKNHKANSNNSPVDIKIKGRSTRSKIPAS
ncbi:PREDICTED: zinc finger protein 800 isoform X2 [Nanorana parkeri]|uniref:zinc finger protein 800 isoform X2 n=1 Tax=Nanorana parkeri TaxID=125878 RepID=UPI0008543371|nr:PREDICTED: zinc finger protein 800 isoform X2 [Nanorana parkeri]